MARFSILDHFVLSQGLFDNLVVSASTLHDVDNFSDHKPLCLVLRMDVDLNKVTNRMPTDKIAWYKANEIQLAAYREALAANFAATCVPFDAIFCRDVCCTSCSHHSLIADYSMRISDAWLAAADSCLPHTCLRCPLTGLPGWTKFVAPFRE